MNLFCSTPTIGLFFHDLKRKEWIIKILLLYLSSTRLSYCISRFINKTSILKIYSIYVFLLLLFLLMLCLKIIFSLSTRFVHYMKLNYCWKRQKKRFLMKSLIESFTFSFLLLFTNKKVISHDNVFLNLQNKIYFF